MQKQEKELCAIFSFSVYKFRTCINIILFPNVFPQPHLFSSIFLENLFIKIIMSYIEQEVLSVRKKVF